MKTIKTLAGELGVSKQTVLNRINTLGLKDSLEKAGKQYVVNENQEKIIKNSFGQSSNYFVDRQNKFVDRQIYSSGEPMDTPGFIAEDPLIYGNNDNLSIVKSNDQKICRSSNLVCRSSNFDDRPDESAGVGAPDQTVGQFNDLIDIFKDQLEEQKSQSDLLKLQFENQRDEIKAMREDLQTLREEIKTKNEQLSEALKLLDQQQKLLAISEQKNAEIEDRHGRESTDPKESPERKRGRIFRLFSAGK